MEQLNHIEENPRVNKGDVKISLQILEKEKTYPEGQQSSLFTKEFAFARVHD